jgi:hypothetical protein
VIGFHAIVARGGLDGPKSGEEAIGDRSDMWSRGVVRTGFFLSFGLTLLSANALAQDMELPKGIPPVQDSFAKHHMSPLGRPCLEIQGYARPELVNKNIYQHLIKTDNSCGQTIQVQVCYYKSDRCILISVPAYEKKEAVLGIFPALKRFQFEAKEKF